MSPPPCAATVLTLESVWRSQPGLLLYFFNISFCSRSQLKQSWWFLDTRTNLNDLNGYELRKMDSARFHLKSAVEVKRNPDSKANKKLCTHSTIKTQNSVMTSRGSTASTCRTRYGIVLNVWSLLAEWRQIPQIHLHRRTTWGVVDPAHSLLR